MGLITGLWAAWNFWAIVMVVSFMAFMAFGWKVASTPTDSTEKEAWKQARINRKHEVPAFKRFTVSLTILIANLMASTLFVIAIFKTFS